MIVFAAFAGLLLVIEVVLGGYLVVRALVERWQERKRFSAQGRDRVGITNRRVP